MKVVSVFDTSIANYNLGNQIIMEAVYKHFTDFLDKKYFLYNIPYIDITTHSLSCLKSSDIAIWGGTNSLCGEMEKYTQWGINIKNVKNVEQKVILMGLGWWQYQDNVSCYTKKLLHLALNAEYLSSVRDQYSADKMKKIGFDNIINTGCPTLWELTEEHCRDIPDGISSDKAIITFTDYKKNKDRDLNLFSVVKKYYKHIFIWPQGVGDINYIEKELQLSDVNILPPRLVDFDNFLAQQKPDYIGTRLHAGIRSLQKKCRSIIIVVDNRANEMGKDFCLPIVEISQLESMITKKFSPIAIPTENIKIWKEQFLNVSNNFNKNIKGEENKMLLCLTKKILTKMIHWKRRMVTFAVVSV